jgi:alpha-tubulin suppressor-like RCC1 family protein
LGLGHQTIQHTPQLISSLKGEKIKTIECSSNHTIVQTGKFKRNLSNVETGIYSFGMNAFGQLGIGNKKDQYTPQLISSLKNEKIKNIACEKFLTYVVTGMDFLIF